MKILRSGETVFHTFDTFEANYRKVFNPKWLVFKKFTENSVWYAKL